MVLGKKRVVKQRTAVINQDKILKCGVKMGKRHERVL
jgi:hypothetical protein